ncbi:MAG: phosphoenolpyruvate carboxylase [Francisellaceae bacterium]|jgi:phosphoenolpyruvate carboxylase
MSNYYNPNLKADVDLLGRILGKVITKQCGEENYELIEKVRLLSIDANKNHNQNYLNQVANLMRELDSNKLFLVARSFGHFLNLVNISESMHGADIERPTHTFEQLVDLILEKKISKSKLQKTIENLSIELVLTAHPTEVKRRTLIQKYSQISELIKKRKLVTDYHKQDIDRQLYTLITSTWLTDEIRRKKPTPLEEAKWGFAVIEETLWDAIPWYLRRLDYLLESKGLDKLHINTTPITFGSWMGGDRDGNPFVISNITERAVLAARWTAFNLYFKEVNSLVQSISLNDCSDEIKKISNNDHEPYRYTLRILRDKIAYTRNWLSECINKKTYIYNEKCINSKAEISKVLMLIYDSLCSVNAEAVANNHLLDLIRRLNTFDLCLVKLDIRQEGTRHQNVIAKICRYLNFGNYQKWSEDKKCNWLIQELSSKRPLLPYNCPFDAEEQEVIDTLKTIARLPSDQFGAYIISMASTVSDVLSVCLLQKICGIENQLRTVPLFETLDDLNNAPAVLDKLFSIEDYKLYSNKKQEVMIGYSDSGKDAGKLAASWALYQAQSLILDVAKKHHFKVNFFHGRGGTVGRGGGPVQAAMLSQPPGTVDGNLRVTEQGEVIQQKYGSARSARHNLILYASSVVEATLLPPSKPKDEWISLMDELSAISTKSYRKTVMDDPEFLDYFHNATPGHELGRLSIGSRPAKRKSTGGIETLRAIPWMFAWIQLRLILPAWLGMDVAFKKAIDEGKLDTLQAMISDWPFFLSFMDVLDMVLTKADSNIASFYDRALVNKSLRDYGAKLREHLKEVNKYNDIIAKDLPIEEERHNLRGALEYRKPYIDPINILQAEVLKRLKFDKLNVDDKTQLENALMLSISGIAAGMKNTG